MAFIDEMALPVALPAIQTALDATVVDAQWMVAAYTLFLASGLTDRYCARLPLVVGSANHRGRIRSVRRAWDRGLVLDYLLPCGRAFGDRALDPGTGGDHGHPQRGGHQASGVGFCDQQRLLPNSRASSRRGLERHHVRQLLPAEARERLEEEKVDLGAAEAPKDLDPELGAQVDQALDETFVSGYRVVMLVATAMALVSAISAALLVEGKKLWSG